MFCKSTKLKVAGVTFLMICLTFVFLGCSSSTSDSETGDAPAKLLFLGYGEGSAGTILTAKVGELMLELLPAGSSVRTTVGSSIGNLQRCGEGQADIVATVATYVAASQDKEAPFEQGLPNIRTIASISPGGSPFYICSNGKSGIASFEDMKDKPFRLVVREKGSTGEFFAEKILMAHGITYEDIQNNGGEVVFTSNSEAVSRMQDGHSDVWIAIGGSPFGPLLELTTATRNIIMIDYDPAIVEEFNKKYLFDIIELPAGTYPGQDEVYLINGSLDYWATREDVPNDVVYSFLEAIYDNEQDFRAVHKYAEGFDWEISAKTPYLHPGAEKFYQDKGMLP